MFPLILKKYNYNVMESKSVQVVFSILIYSLLISTFESKWKTKSIYERSTRK